jgi:aminoglycoside phosphotransferase
VTSTATAQRTLSGLLAAVGGRVVALAMSKDPHGKVTLLLFRPGEDLPCYVAKVPTGDAAVRDIEREAAALRRLGALDLGPLARTVPTLVAVAEHRGRPVLVTTALPGRQMLADYHTWRHTARPAPVEADFRAAGDWLTQVHHLTSGRPVNLATMLDGVDAVIARRFGRDPETTADLEYLAALRDRLADHSVPQVLAHHDYWPGNLLVAQGRVCGVIDWEAATPEGLAARDLARFATAYSLYLDRHTRSGRSVPGHPGLRCGVWGVGLDHAITGDGWYPELVRQFVGEGLQRVGVPASCARTVMLAEIACIAAEADHPDFARNHLRVFRRLRRAVP